MSSSDVVLLQGEPTPTYPTAVEIDRNIAEQSKTLKDMIEDFGGLNVPIEILNQSGGEVGRHSSDVIAAVFSYLSKKGVAPPLVAGATAPTAAEEQKKELEQWEKEMFANMSMKMLFDFILLSNWLDTKPALAASCKYVASLIKGKSPEEIRKTFAIPAQ